jgi:hypothetical protein
MKLVSRHHTTVSLQGNIAVVELSNIFQIFDYGKMSGELRIISEQNNASFFFQEGMLIFGALSVNQKKIGELLLESQLITAVQLRQCLEIHAKFGRRRRLGEILVGNGFLDFEKLAEILKNQAREAFYETLSWNVGMFYYYADQYPSGQEILLNDRIDHLLLEGFVRMDNALAVGLSCES